MSDDFEWIQSKNDDVVFPSTRGVAVYRNPEGDVVIRQEAGALDEEDTFVIVPVDQAERLARAIIAAGQE